MIKRIVKMVFKSEHIEIFLDIFEARKEKIATFEGCMSLELVQDVHDPCTFFTLSIWESEKALEAYRNSDFFQSTWKATKALFAGTAEAWTTRHV